MSFLGRIPPYYVAFVFPLVVSAVYFLDLLFDGVLFRQLGERDRFLAYYHAGVPAVWLLLAACTGKQKLNAEFSITFHLWKKALVEVVGTRRQWVLPGVLFALLIALEMNFFAPNQSSRAVVFLQGGLPLDYFDPTFVTLLIHGISSVASLKLAAVLIHVLALIVLWLTAHWVVRGACPALLGVLIVLLVANDGVLLFFRLLVPEFPAAVAGTLGIVFIARRAPHVGLAFLAFACLLRTPGILFMVTGLLLIAAMIARGHYRLRDINYVYLTLLGIACLYEFVNVYLHYQNSLGNFVASQLDPNAGPLGPLELIVNLWRLAPVFATVTVAGGLYGAVRRDRQTLNLWGLFVLAAAVRFLTFTELHIYYGLYYAPFALLVGCSGFTRLAADVEHFRPSMARAPVALLLAMAAVPVLMAAHSWWTDPFNAWRGDAPRLVRDLATLPPEGTEVLERRSNLVLYVKALHGRKLPRTLMANNRDAALRLVDKRIASLNCVIMIITREYLGDHLGIARDELAARGFVDAADIFGVPPYRFPDRWILARPGCSAEAPDNPATGT
jgi:hypothetical protein